MKRYIVAVLLMLSVSTMVSAQTRSTVKTKKPEPDPAKQAAIDKFIKDFRANPERFPDFSKVKLPAASLEIYESSSSHRPATADEALRVLASAYLFGTKCLDLGGGVTWREGPWWSNGCLRCRDCHYEASACLSHPDLESVWNDVVECAKYAAGVAGIACIIAGPEACLPTFKAAFIACMEAKGITWAKDITISLGVSTQCGGDFCCY